MKLASIDKVYTVVFTEMEINDLFTILENATFPKESMEEKANKFYEELDELYRKER